MSRSLVVSIDVECDKGPDWRTAAPLAFRGVEVGIGARLQPLFERLGIRPTWLLSPEVLCHAPSMALLRGLGNCELGAHLHGDYIAPAVRTWDFAGQRTDDMQREYGSDLEGAKLATLTELFRQQVGRAPVSFRAGRFGIGRHSGRLLQQLGYLIDSSVTPCVQWTTQQGHRVPDFRDAETRSYFTSAHGDLLQPGDSALLEVPVTIRRDAEGRASWLRPWYSTRSQLLQLIDAVAAEADTPLCMMFHNVELIAKGSPYPQTEAEVARYLDDLAAALQYAQQRGFAPRTLQQVHALAMQQRAAAPTHPVLADSGSRRARSPRASAEQVTAIVERHAAPGWHSYAHRERESRWDLTEPYSWLADHLAVDAAILDVGCGIGSNLLYLADAGFTDLSGFDRDPTAIAAGTELFASAPHPARLWVDDGLRPLAIPERRFDAITALNWTHLVPDFDLEAFLHRFAALLHPGGRLVLDVIDRAFDQHPMSRWRSGDWNKPEAERQPSEYRHRFDRGDLLAAAAASGLCIAAELRRPQEICKAVYVLEKPYRPRLLFVVDEPGWAHDHKTDALQAELGDEFDVDKRYQDQVTAADVAAADLVVVFYWLQIAGCAPLRLALEGAMQKVVLGVCSHAELQGERRAAALALLRQAPALFVHSELLRREVAPLCATGQPLFTVPNGVDTAQFTPVAAPDRAESAVLRVGWAGSAANFGRDLRGLDEIERTCASVPGVEFTPALKEQGQRDHAAMAAYYRGIDVYVCMSRCEGTPNPALEAAASGVPLVTTRVGNMPEFVRDGENGLFVRRGDGSLAAALQRLREPALRRRLGEAARFTALSWSWSVRSRAYAAMFRSLLRGFGVVLPPPPVHVVVTGAAAAPERHRQGTALLRQLRDQAGELRIPAPAPLHQQIASASAGLSGWLLFVQREVTPQQLTTALRQRGGQLLVLTPATPNHPSPPFALITAAALQTFPLCGGDAAWDLQWQTLQHQLDEVAVG